jgi:hydrogenase-1 operon protein HyaE
MATPAIDRLSADPRCATVTEDTAAKFLADAPDDVSVLFFTGDPNRRPEANDVAVVLRELLKTHDGKLRAAVVDREAEEALKPAYGVLVMPSLVFMKGDGFLGLIPRVKDWTVYEAETERFLAGAETVSAVKH